VAGFDRYPDAVQLFGPVNPIERTFKNSVSLALANAFARAGYYTRTFYYTLGCNTAFRKDAFIRAGMYRCVGCGGRSRDRDRHGRGWTELKGKG